MKKYYSYFLILCTLSCTETKHTLISGDINNLPDGKMYLYKDNVNNRIDSTIVKNGKFNFDYIWNDSEPVYLGLDHVDKKKVTRAFNFPTESKYLGAGWNSPNFLSDSIIKITGKIIDFELKDLKLPDNFKFVTTQKIVAGKQTLAFYNIDNDIFDQISNGKVEIIKEKIKIYPYSYHLLYKINETKNSFSAKQLDSLLDSFKGDIRKSETYKNLKAYNDKRFNEKTVVLPLLEDNTGKKTEIINKKYKKHLIVFWASWCGPCRQEIPILKKIHSQYKDKVEFISISLDEDKKSWKEALALENMTWKQLIVNKKNITDYEALQIHYKLDQAIPYTVLIDSNNKILSKTTGLSNEKELIELLKK
ncbi:TlpA disulfide reductase family protein [Chryseobacterium binzhouense]|uniref:TlpA disulfide reductase family protein n=1 Tax=Chryseobacterium binzhouense TaxID=2593646 RepID=UPI0028A16F49|nr:TlpA disulfide reductase family protein [Chryseobacterium binzhouense]